METSSLFIIINMNTEGFFAYFKTKKLSVNRRYTSNDLSWWPCHAQGTGGCLHLDTGSKWEEEETALYVAVFTLIRMQSAWERELDERLFSHLDAGVELEGKDGTRLSSPWYRCGAGGLWWHEAVLTIIQMESEREGDMRLLLPWYTVDAVGERDGDMSLFLPWYRCRRRKGNMTRVSSKQSIFFSVRTETNQNSICFSCFLVCFVKPKNTFFTLLQFFSVFQTGIETTETNRTLSK